MEKLNFVKNGVSRLPPGFRFQPTDQELVFQYLKSKIFSLPLPASIIPELNVCNFDPWNLPGDSDKEERYFFSAKEAKYRNGNRMNRTTMSGYWKATGSDKKLTSSRSRDIVGIRKTLVFYEGNSPNGSKTDWIMHEYRLVTACDSTSQEIGDWVLCRIFMKKGSGTEDDGDGNGTRRRRSHMVENADVAQPRFVDFVKLQDLHAAASSSCSSSNGVTEGSSNVWDHEETSAYTGF